MKKLLNTDILVNNKPKNKNPKFAHVLFAGTKLNVYFLSENMRTFGIYFGFWNKRTPLGVITSPAICPITIKNPIKNPYKGIKIILNNEVLTIPIFITIVLPNNPIINEIILTKIPKEIVCVNPLCFKNFILKSISGNEAKYTTDTNPIIPNTTNSKIIIMNKTGANNIMLIPICPFRYIFNLLY